MTRILPFAQTFMDDLPTGFMIGLVAGGVIGLILLLLMIASWWRIFEKAGEGGWKILIPLYNIYIMLKVAQKPGWFLILLFVPILNLFIWLVVMVDLAHLFDHSTEFGVAMLFFWFLFIPVLGFGSAKYRYFDPSNTNVLPDITDELRYLPPEPGV